MNQVLSYTFEMVNGFLMIAIAAAIVFFAAFLYRRVRAGAIWKNINIAAALLLILFGDVIIRAPVWWYRHNMNHGASATSLDLTVFTVIVIVGGTLSSIGLLYLIHAATPDLWKPWPWLLTLAVSAGFAAVGLWG